MTTNTDAAREAANTAFKLFRLSSIVPTKYSHLENTAANHRGAMDAAIDAFLSKALEGADEKLAEIRERNGKEGFAVSDRAELLTLVTALSAKLAAQKAAHTKLLRDEADKLGDWPPLVSRHIRRLADKIEGGE